jgi:iron complex outermembrane receptor protein
MKHRQLMFRSNMSGLSPLVEAINQHGSKLDGALIFDKVIGRAAAFLIVHAGIRKVYTPIISGPAMDILRSAHCTVGYLEKVSRILDKQMVDLEPTERLALDATTPSQFIKLLR